MTDKQEALDRLIAAVEAGEDWIGPQASEALEPQQYVDALRAYGEGGTRPSLNAALALHEALLPGWDYLIGQTNGGLTAHAQLENETSFSETPARAWLLAILRAYRTQIGGEA